MTKERKNFETFQEIKRDVEKMDAVTFDRHYWFQCLQFVYRSWVPRAREGAVIINLPHTNTCYLYGGVANEPLNGIAKLSVYGSTDCKWDIVFPKLSARA